MRYFTDAQLKEEARPLSDLALEALDAGDMERVVFLLNEMATGHRELQALLVHWLARMIAKIRTDFGEEFLDDALLRTAGYLVEPYVKAFRAGEEKQTIAELVQIFTTQAGATLSPLRATADAASFLLAPCGTGGCLQLEGWAQAMPEHYAPLANRTPPYCYGCQALQRAFNQGCGHAAWSARPRPGLLGSCEMTFRVEPSARTASAGVRDAAAPPLFDAAELYALGKTRVRRALEQLATGDRGIHELIRDQQHEWMPMHDLGVKWATYLMSAVCDTRGADYLLGFLEHTYNSAFEPLYMAYEMLDDVSMMRMLARVWHYHMATFRIEEDEDRFAFVLDPCGSGGRLFREETLKDSFRYGDGRALLMKEPHDINFHRCDFPVYCTHCASTNRAQFEGRPWMFLIDGHAQRKPGQPCVQYLYKKGAKREIAPEMAAQVGVAIAKS